MKKRRIKIIGSCTGTKSFRDTLFFAVLMFLMAAGVSLGAFFGAPHTVNVSDVFPAVGAFFGEARVSSFGMAFLVSLLSSGSAVLCCFLFGFCVIGQPFHAAVLVYRGLVLGAASARIYSLYGARGFIITLLLAVPCTIFSSFAIILSAREGMRFSKMLMKLVTGSADIDPKEKLKLYMLKFSVIFAIILLSSLFDAALAAFAASA